MPFFFFQNICLNPHWIAARLVERIRYKEDFCFLRAREKISYKLVQIAEKKQLFLSRSRCPVVFENEMFLCLAGKGSAFQQY